MIDDKFSAQSFQKSGYGTKKARDLSNELEKQIELEIDKAIRSALEGIIKKLNSLGHELVLDDDTENICNICYIDPRENEYPRYKLLVGVDAVISVGYPDTVRGDRI